MRRREKKDNGRGKNRGQEFGDPGVAYLQEPEGGLLYLIFLDYLAPSPDQPFT